jgi:predicted amidohydrolase
VLAAAGCGGGDEVATAAPSCSVIEDPAADVRVFVVGHKHAVADAESYESYQASYRRHVDRLLPCLGASQPNLIVFPEGSGLVAAAIGSRAAAARQERELIPAFLMIAQAYEGPRGALETMFGPLSLQESVLLALSDVIWRATITTFGGIARDHGVWVIANTDVARVEYSTDATLVAALGDPDLAGADGVYVPVGPEIYNTTLLFDPSGSLVAREDKVFLTDPEEDLLALTNGEFAGAGVMNTPFATIAAPISRDAFYAPYMQRMDDLGADLSVQPEAFSGWAVQQEPGDWLPDVFIASAWHHTQKYGGIRFNVTPQLTGNYFDMVFDGQVTVVEKARPDGPTAGYIGQNPIPGHLAIGPWVAVDDGSQALGDRRAALAEVGAALLPGSGDARENGYIDSLVGVDLRLSREPVAVTRDPMLPESRPVTGPGAAPQRAPAIVATDDGVGLAWHEGGDVYLAVSTDGETFGAPAKLGPGHRPALCAAPDGRVLAVWQSGPPGQERVMAAVTDSLTTAFAAPLAFEDAGPQWWPTCAFRDAWLIVFVDLRTGVPRLRYLSGDGPGFAPSSPVDDSTLDAPRLEGSQLSPALDGGHLVWLDYRDRSWDVFYSRFDGVVFPLGARIDGVESMSERLHADPRVVAEGDDVLVTFTDLHDRRAHSDAAFVTSSDGGSSWSSHQVLVEGPELLGDLSSGGAALSRFRPFPASPSVIVFSSVDPGKNAIFRASLGSVPQRVDDTASSPVSLSHPVAVARNGSLLVAWEDDREGPLRLHFSQSP